MKNLLAARRVDEMAAKYFDPDSSSDDDMIFQLLSDPSSEPQVPYDGRGHPFDDPMLGDNKFKARYRLGRPTVQMLLTKIKRKLEYLSKRNHSVTPMNQLLLTLRFYATGTFQLVTGDIFGVDKSTVSRTAHKVSEAIAALANEYIRFPSTEEEINATKQEFFNVARIPGVLGCIDCMHVPIASPGGDDAETFRNRNDYFSLNVQLVCNASLFVTNVVARWPGSVDDPTIFDFSGLCATMEKNPGRDGFLIGDGGYPCKPYLLTPLTCAQTTAEMRYNVAHASTRNCIERCIDEAKRRFPALKLGLRLKLKNVPAIVVAIMVLHNIALAAGEDDPPEDTELKEFVEHSKSLGRQVEFLPVEEVPPPHHLTVAEATWQRAAIVQLFE